MKSIEIPPSFARSWVTGVIDEALPYVLIDQIHQSEAQVTLVLCASYREIQHHLNRIEAVMDYPSMQSLAVPVHEIPLLSDYQKLESQYQYKQFDLLRTLADIRKSLNEQKKICLFTIPPALFQELPAPDHIEQNSINLKTHAEQPFVELKALLAEKLGYSYEAVCETPGQFASRGGLLDIYPSNALAPYRVDFFGDTIDSIKRYDPTTQLTEDPVEQIQILPANVSDTQNPESAQLIDHIAQECQWILVQPNTLAVEYPNIFTRPERMDKVSNESNISEIWNNRSYNDTWVAFTDISQKPDTMGLEEPTQSIYANALEIHKHDWVTLKNTEIGESTLMPNEKKVIEYLADRSTKGYQCRIGLHKVEEQKRLQRLVQKDYPTFQPEIAASALPRGVVFHASKGNYYPEIFRSKDSRGIIWAADVDLHPTLRLRLGRKNQRKLPQISQVDSMLDFTELADGDYLVHQLYGICIFRGVNHLDFETSRESISLEFSDEAMIHVPLNESHLLTRYVGLSKRAPKLGKIGTNQWEKDRKNAEKATLDLAAELLALQAKRESHEGFAYPPDNAWQKQFEQAFPYQETPDQLTAIENSKEDLESPKPMDRLICGDVGFGKTEVALRAAMKVLSNDKQVALLVPTTVLCQQHYLTFRDRMVEFPIQVEMLSRFKTQAEQSKIVQSIKSGNTDIVVATQRILSEDIAFNDLGLIIVDEEHRFGVKQKERLKVIAENVDVLSLSATPIPRTLYLALSGARDLSVIETPPQNRLPIETIVKDYSPELVDSAIQAEINRGGQVFYLHNRVQTIHKVAAMINDRNKNIRVAVGHGQMNEHDLEKIMTDFVAGHYDVLVCTTIIESGLDIPNCNTLIIEGADKFGLAQLYQIRGRVGRFNKQAYAYLLLHGKKPVASTARKRLSAIKQYNELGAGYRIAMRDLELRGAGNILGAAQSGHIAGVGFELYCRLLKQSVERLKKGIGIEITRAAINLDFVLVGEPSNKSGRSQETKIGYAALKNSEINEAWPAPIHAYIPVSYIQETKLRIDFYRKLASAATVDEVKSLRLELKDRFGKIPDNVEALIRISAVRCLAESKKITLVECTSGKLVMRIGNPPNHQFIKEGNRFPRLTPDKPLLLLNNLIKYMSKM